MTTRQIEECFENVEEEKYTEWIKVLIPKDTFAIVIDPYMINIKDLTNVRPDSVPIVRIRRPGWGRGDIQNYIHILGENLCPLKSISVR